MTIPKVVYQTHPTCRLPKVTINAIQEMKAINPEYEFVQYDDQQIDEFVKTYFDNEVYDCFSSLNYGAAKADLWRYCLMYQKGGIYLDIDSIITGSLDEIIESHDDCIVTRENNPAYFNQWILISAPGNQIFARAINICCQRIRNYKPDRDNIVYVTGPGAFTTAVNDMINSQNIQFPTQARSHWYRSDDELNKFTNNSNILQKSKCKFYKFDLGTYAKFKYKGFMDLYNHGDDSILHWGKNNTPLVKSNK